MAIAGTFDPAAIEGDLYATWEREGLFAPDGNGKPYSIAIPPPNVTDRLHVGHAFQHTLMDALIRYQRMNGARALWQTGTDHAQIATQMVVERQLLAQGIALEDIGRDGFVAKVWEWKESTGDSISSQIRRMGSSVDWARERFTMDEGFSRAVTEVFVRLHEDGLIYRGKRLVNWDPQLKTSISRSGSGERRRAGPSLAHPLSAGERRRHGGRPTPFGGGDHAPGDNARRYRGGGPSKRRTLCSAGGVRSGAAAGRTPHSGDRGRLRGPRFRFRLRQDHPGARFQRPRHRAAPRPRDDQHPERRCQRERQRAAKLPGSGSLRSPQAHRRRPRCRWPPRVCGTTHGHRAEGRPLEGDRRTVADRPVVREDRPARRAGHRCRGRRRREVRAEAVRKHVLRLDAQHPGLVHQPPAVVGASHSRLVRRARQRLCGAQRNGSEGARRLGRGRGAAPGRRRAGHVVFVRLVDLRHARLAGEDAGTRRLPPHQRAGDGLRHHLLLGGRG